MILTFGTRFHQCPNNVIPTSTTISALRFTIKHLVASLQKVTFSHGNGGHVGLSFIRPKELCCKRMGWSIKSSADGRGLDPLTDNGDGRTRLLKTIRTLQIRLNARILDLRKDLPKKFLFFLVGFYCATAFATMIGQTGDWDILSAAVAAAVVEGIGALMYKASVPFLDKSRNLIVMFNYWKAGLTLGLFLDSFNLLIQVLRCQVSIQRQKLKIIVKGGSLNSPGMMHIGFDSRFSPSMAVFESDSLILEEINVSVATCEEYYNGSGSDYIMPALFVGASNILTQDAKH